VLCTLRYLRFYTI